MPEEDLPNNTQSSIITQRQTHTRVNTMLQREYDNANLTPHDLLDQYLQLIDQHGLRSQKVGNFLLQHTANTEFQSLAKTAKWLFLALSADDNATQESEPFDCSAN